MSFDLANLASDAALAQDAIRSCDRAASEWELGTEHLSALLAVRRMVLDIVTDARSVIESIENAVGQVMDSPTADIDGFGMVKRHPRINQRNWQSDDLLRAVMDSRLVDEDGVVVEETPLDRIKHVYPLAGYQARVTALRKRHIDPDEYSETERRGWRLEMKGHNK